MTQQTLKVNLHSAQLDIFKSNKRFKAVAAGRRFGKTRLAAWMLLIKALKSPSVGGKDVFYIAPTYQQAKDVIWEVLKEIGRPVIKSTLENTSVITLINDRKIYLKGSDRPDTLRGVGLCFVVLDEYASMKPVVWEQIIRPTLADVKGEALFIGTPAGKNHFYDLFTENQDDPEWDFFTYKSTDNPFLDPSEIEAASRQMSSQAFRQEFEASFESFNSGIFEEDWIKYEEEPKQGSFYVSVDLAGFEEVAEELRNKKQRLDETAIAIAKIDTTGWWVKEIVHGRWNIRETSVRIMKAARDCNAMAVGIEKGSLKNAVHPYLEDQMRRLSFFPRIIETTHGNRKKTERIVWSLQGRFEHGRIKLNRGNWNKPFVSQLLDFPNPLTHDDMVDALSYIDQVAITDYAQSFDYQEWEPIDDISGY